jgi:hypothetical protein
MRPDGLEDAPQLQLDIDRDKANALGVPFEAIGSALSTPSDRVMSTTSRTAGRLQRVVVQADAPARMQPIGPAAHQRAQHAGTGGAAVEFRQHALGRRSDADDPLQRLFGDAPVGRSGAGLQQRRRDGRDGAAGRRSCPTASASNGPASRARSAWPVPRPSSCSALRCWRCSWRWPPCTKAGRSRWR